MEKLNKLEIEVLEKLCIKYPNLQSHIPFLRVRNRELTGVGMYVNFDYLSNINLEKLEDTSLSTNDIIKLDSLKDGLGYEVDITDGKINFIEFVTYGEDWDGKIDNYSWC